MFPQLSRWQLNFPFTTKQASLLLQLILNLFSSTNVRPHLALVQFKIRFFQNFNGHLNNRIGSTLLGQLFRGDGNSLIIKVKVNLFAGNYICMFFFLNVSCSKNGPLVECANWKNGMSQFSYYSSCPAHQITHLKYHFHAKNAVVLLKPQIKTG